ncbi:MAG: polyisoprenyl-phosphate glycosyltransferase [Hyphomicrobiales bacterium]|jgi:dolichol-phosphate mannosyltransferase|nr:polyisoprenyl-phosphate glycosyltransferase [Hyphomicrobiales bacterium]
MSIPTLSFVLPAHNEAHNVAGMAARLAEVAAPFGAYEIVFVDDGSTDGTLTAIRALAARDPAVRYVSFTRNFGHQAALRAGLRHARGRAVIAMDCDFEHPPEVAKQLIEQWQAGAKIVATRRLDADGPNSTAKKTSSRLFYRVLDALGDVHIEPGSADFMLLDRAAVDVINALEDQDVFLRGLIRWLGFPLATVSYVQGVRQAGASKFTLRRMIDFAVTGIVAHSIKPLRLAIHLALMFALIGILLLVYSVVSFLFIGHTVAGWPSIMAVIAMLGAGQFLVLGIIGEYVGRILGETRRRPVYIVAATESSDAGRTTTP